MGSHLDSIWIHSSLGSNKKSNVSFYLITLGMWWRPKIMCCCMKISMSTCGRFWDKHHRATTHLSACLLEPSFLHQMSNTEGKGQDNASTTRKNIHVTTSVSRLHLSSSWISHLWMTKTRMISNPLNLTQQRCKKNHGRGASSN